MIATEHTDVKDHEFFPLNVGPAGAYLNGVAIPMWIELADHRVYVPVDLSRPIMVEAFERSFDFVPDVVYRLTKDTRSLLERTDIMGRNYQKSHAVTK